MRRRLSNIELLPDAALPAVHAALDRIAGERMMQCEILTIFNSDLAEIGFPPVSRSAFSRYVLKVRAAKVKRPEPN